MTQTEFGITRATPSLPSRDLLRVPHKNRVLAVSYPAFGPGTYRNNLTEMPKQYSHSKEIPILTFRPATTSESISASAYKFTELAKPEIFDPRWLQAGRIVRTSEGVFTNTSITDERELKTLLNNVKKSNGIYLVDDKIAFAPYETFRTEIQESGDFVEGGLARALEHTPKKVAQNLKEISNPILYKSGVNVWGWDAVKEPVERVASFYSSRDDDGYRLTVLGDNWYDNDGYAFGVFENADELGARKI